MLSYLELQTVPISMFLLFRHKCNIIEEEASQRLTSDVFQKPLIVIAARTTKEVYKHSFIVWFSRSFLMLHDQVSIFSKFPIKDKERTLPCNSFIARDRTDGFMPFSLALV